jgi:hypothetical protein
MIRRWGVSPPSAAGPSASFEAGTSVRRRAALAGVLQRHDAAEVRCKPRTAGRQRVPSQRLSATLKENTERNLYGHTHGK